MARRNTKISRKSRKSKQENHVDNNNRNDSSDIGSNSIMDNGIPVKRPIT